MENNTESINENPHMLSALREPLESIANESEAKFISLGNDLQSMYSETEGIALLSLEIANLIRGKSNGNALSEIGEYSNRSMQGLDLCRAQISEILPDVQSCLSYSKRLHDMCPIIMRIAKNLNMAAMNISIESSRHDKSDDTFNIFVKDIKGLAQKINNIACSMKNDSEILSANQRDDFNLLLERRDKMSRIADEARDMVSSNIEQIENLLGKAIQVLLSSESHSRRLSDLVGNVVVSIQFHDITRQQIDHVIHALHDMEDVLKCENNDLDNPEEGDASFAKARSILSIQISQVEEIISEISEAHDKINHSFEEIIKEIDTLVGDTLSFQKGSMTGGLNKGQFNILISGLEKLDMVMIQGKELGQDIEEIIKESSSSASTISNYLGLMEDISMDLHIKAINALIMSRQLGGNGVTLGVLAQDVREISKGSNELVVEIMNILRSIDGLAKRLGCVSSGNGHQEKGEKHEGTTFRIGVENIDLIYDEFLEKTGGFIRRSGDLKERLSYIKSHLDFFDVMKGNLNRTLNEMENSIKKYDRISWRKGLWIPEADKIKERYTMRIERKVHQKAVDNAAVDLSKIIEDEWDNNEFGNNVKFF